MENWINLSQTAGTGNATITVSASSYIGLVDRMTTLTASTSTAEAQVSILQNYTVVTDADYLTFVVLTGGTINWVQTNEYPDPNPWSLEYSRDGVNWTRIWSLGSGTTLSVEAGDVLMFRGDNLSYAGSHFSGGTAYFNVRGNIMSLINSTDFENLKDITGKEAFARLFYKSRVVDASNLLLPATGLSEGCYHDLFMSCEELIAAPDLPATTLSTNCYTHMFAGCNKLTQAPELPAPVLTFECYYNMFGATKVNYVKCLAIDISAERSTLMWLGNPAQPTGTFVKDPTMTGWTLNSTNGVPPGWTVVDYGVVTALSLTNLTWVTDVPSFGGTADKTNCDYDVLAYYEDGRVINVKTVADVSGSIVVPETTATTRQTIGTLTLTAEYYGFTSSGSVTAYQEAAPAEGEYFTIDVEYGYRRYFVCIFNDKDIEYSIDGGNWQTGSRLEIGGPATVRFRGNNTSLDGCLIGAAPDVWYKAKFSVRGNIMSLLDKTNFPSMTQLTEPNVFKGLFAGSEVTDASALLLPATGLSENCYMQMFKNCKSLTLAPVLPAPVLVNGCYFEMFYGCDLFGLVVCLRSVDGGFASTLGWLSGVHDTGTFIKAPGYNWERGPSGIPNGWVIQDAT